MFSRACSHVREHHAPVGALRHHPRGDEGDDEDDGQGAPRTCRCIETESVPPEGGNTLLSGSTTHLEGYSGAFERIESRGGSRCGVGAGIRDAHDQWGFTGVAPNRLLRSFTLYYAPFSRTVEGEGA